MAKEISRTFETHLGAVIVTIQDEFGHDSLHTIHLTSDDVDVDQYVAKEIAAADERTAQLKARMAKAGWKTP